MALNLEMDGLHLGHDNPVLNKADMSIISSHLSQCAYTISLIQLTILSCRFYAFIQRFVVSIYYSISCNHERSDCHKLIQTYELDLKEMWLFSWLIWFGSHQFEFYAVLLKKISNQEAKIANIGSTLRDVFCQCFVS